MIISVQHRGVSSSHYQFKAADFALPEKRSPGWMQVSNLGVFGHEIKWPWPPPAHKPPTHIAPRADVLHTSIQTADDKTHPQPETPFL